MKLPVSLQAYSGMKICVACSGGADSVALLHHFHTQAEQFGIAVTAVTCEHGIRGESSLRDAAFVRGLCGEWGIPLFEFSADIPALARTSGRGLEEEAREFRYRCFREITGRGDADAVATAHHEDDVAETVLFRLARGTSLGGLGAVREREGIIRPFLGVKRAEIERYIQKNNLPFVTDESNSDERYTRNRLRASVLPALEAAVAGAGEHLCAFARRAKEDDDFLQSLAEEKLSRAYGEIRVPVSLPAPLFTRACVVAMKELGAVRDYTSANVDEIAALTAVQSGRRACLPCGAEAWREGGEIVFCKPQEPVSGEIAFSEGAFAFGGYELTVQAEKVDGALQADGAAFPENCVIRTRRQGDMFRPYKGSRKPLKEFLTDRKVPARVSRCLPVVALGSEVYAVFGVEISDAVKVTEGTKLRLSLNLKRK